nr:methyltransferase domain-containing protein [uncultured Dongia sp.]
MTSVPTYGCPEAACYYAKLTADSDGLHCPNGHVFPFAASGKVPVFAREAEGANEYAQKDAASIHDNALRWVFSTFGIDEADLRRSLVGRLGLKPGMKVLITGAGAGNDLPYLASALGGSGEIYVQDIAEQMLLAGVDRYAPEVEAAGVTLHFSVSDAMNLPFVGQFFDAAYHFGGINLFPDIAKGIAEMARVVRAGGRIVIGDEGLAPWLEETEVGKALVCNNRLYACKPPLAHLPETARAVELSWELCNTFYVIAFTAADHPLPIDIDVPHVGTRGGSIRSRYYGQIEGIDPVLKERLYVEAVRQGTSRVALIEGLLQQGLPKE